MKCQYVMFETGITMTWTGPETLEGHDRSKTINYLRDYYSVFLTLTFLQGWKYEQEYTFLIHIYHLGILHYHFMS